MDWAAGFLIFFSTLLGVDTLPPPHPDWKIEKNWDIGDNHKSLRASSSAITKLCKTTPTGTLVFPTVVHGVHSVWLDGKLIKTSGDPTFNIASPFYATMSLSCDVVSSASILEWQVWSYSSYFARVATFPSVTTSKFSADFYPITLNIFAFGAMFIFGLFVLVVFHGKISRTETYSIGVGSLLFSIYFLMCVNQTFELPLSMLTAHKFADIGLWLGAILILNGFRTQSLLSQRSFSIFCILGSVGVAQILFGSSGDEIQFGTMIPMPGVFICTLDIVRLLATNRVIQPRILLLNSMGIGIFLIATVNDILVIFGVLPTPMLLAAGMPGALFTFGLALNEKISETYRERDTLLQTLESRVEQKTKSLSDAMTELKRSQAELVQSARLASLGTLSAGIAHEINNAINFVSGAIVPLERQLSRTEMDEVARSRISRLLSSMKEGTTLTVGIVKSLRSYTGLNQADVKTVDLAEVLDSVLMITKSRTRDIKLIKHYQPGTLATIHVVGLNQIIMNLISNAADAVASEDGEIIIRLDATDEHFAISVEDNGCGMSPEVRERIFDPFYTTKEVGKGTGLGMHIVLQEVERHHGHILISSEPGQGTKIEVEFPRHLSDQAREAA